MAVTVISDYLKQKVWAKSTWVEAQAEMFFAPFIGEEEPTSEKAEATSFNSIIVKKTDLMKNKGDQLQIRLLMQLVGSGVAGDSTLEGNEEKLVYHYQNLTVNQLRHAVRMAGKMEEQKSSLSMRTDAKNGLKMWWANQLDTDLLTVLLASPTAGTSTFSSDNRVIYGGDATTVDTLEATDICTPLLLEKAKILARKAVPRIRPIKYKGKEYFVYLCNDFAKSDLGRDDDVKAALQNAWWQGEDNPLFSGADFVWKGMIVRSYAKMPELTNTGSIPYTQSLLLGAQAGSLAVANAGGENKRGEMDWNEEYFDYKNQVGFEAGMIYGAAKNTFNSRDLGAISVYHAYTDLS